MSLSTRFNRLALQQKYLLASLILLVAAAFILASRVSASMQRGAEADAHEIAETTANHLLFELSLPIVGPLSESDFAETDIRGATSEEKRVRQVRIWSPGRKLLFTLEKGKIRPLREADIPRFQQARSGKDLTFLHHYESPSFFDRAVARAGWKEIDPRKLQRFPDHYHSFLPVRLQPDGPVEGVAEITQGLPELYRTSNQMVIEIWMAVAIVFGALYGLLYLFYNRSALLPIRKMVLLAEDYTLGRYKKRAEIQSEDEFGKLARALNQLAEALETREADLNHRWHELREKNMELKRSNRVRDEFLANTSHELRTPMNSIIGFTTLLLEGLSGDLNDKQRKDLGKVLSSANRLLDLINDLLEVAYIDSGEAELDLSQVHLSSLVREVAEELSESASAKGIRIQCRPNGVGLVLADRSKLRRALMHLSQNALKFTSEGEVHLKARHLGDRVEVSVSDTGIGIPPSELPHVWDDFVQANGSSTRTYPGSGLGLSLVRRIVELHGGEVRAESVEGKGSTFLFTLPAQVIESPAPFAQPEAAKQDGSRILVIDRDEKALEVMSHYLGSGGFEVVAARSGAEGLDLARRLAPDAIVLDVLPDDTDGWTVLQELKSDPQTEHIPVIIVSVTDNMSFGYSLGASDFLVKPLLEEVLLDHVQQALQGVKGYILVADDNKEDAELVMRLLQSTGYQARWAAGGQEALRMAADRPPNLVILDLVMPDLNGVEVLERLRSMAGTRRVPVIVLTGKMLTKVEREQLRQSAAAVLQKGTVRPQDLARQLEETLKKTA